MIYCIGDIHGQKAMLDAALARIESDGGPDAHIVFLGDYLDRGPDSRGVLQTLIDGVRAGRNWTVLKGNHDRYLVKFLDDPNFRDPNTRDQLGWLDARIGGRKTLASYGIDASEERANAAIGADASKAIPQAHVDFINARPLMHVTDHLICVHAGIRPGVLLEDQVEDDLIWIRQPFLDDPRDHGRLVVHGHTVLEAPQHYGNRVNLDGGAAYGRPLTAAVFEGRDCWVLTDAGRVPLTP
ncbi:MAG: metallophosphoesterase family protein [Pseudomonadota bacterium]